MKSLTLLITITVASLTSQAQTYNYYIANDHIVSSTVFEFDVMIQNTSGSDFRLRTVQHCFTFNAGFINGAVVTPTFVAGSSQMANYSPGSILWSSAGNGFQVAANTGVMCNNGTIIPANGTPLQIAKFRLTAASGNFGCASSNPNMVKAGDPPPSGLSLRMVITKWDDPACGFSSNSTITGTGSFTNYISQILYGQIRNMYPMITQQPPNFVYYCSSGIYVDISVAAIGNGLSSNLSYQWYENGVALPGISLTYLGANTSMLRIWYPPSNLNGSMYTCQISVCSPSLTVVSSPCILFIVNPNDNNACTIDDCNSFGQIFHYPVNTNDNNICTIDGCDPLTGIYHNPASEICGNNLDDDCDGSIDESCSLSLHLKVFLEGYYLGNGTMQAAIDPVNYPALCDTLSLELRNISFPYNTSYSNKSTLNINGISDFIIPNALGNSYYLVVKHRNALETWTASPVLLNSSNINYSFADTSISAYGSNLKNLGDGNFALWSGDISSSVTHAPGTQDGIMESQDYSDMENAVSIVLQGYVPEDVTGDGIVESADYSIIENNVAGVIFSIHP